MKDKIITLLLSGVGTAVRRVMIALVGLLVTYKWLPGDQADAFAKGLTALAMAAFEWAAYVWRTRDAKAIQRAVGVEPDGHIGPVTKAAVLDAAPLSRSYNEQ